MTGLVTVPEEEMVMVPSKTSPLFSKNAVPGLAEEATALSFASVFHGVIGFCACVVVRESSPSVEEK